MNHTVQQKHPSILPRGHGFCQLPQQGEHENVCEIRIQIPVRASQIVGIQHRPEICCRKRLTALPQAGVQVRNQGCDHQNNKKSEEPPAQQIPIGFLFSQQQRAGRHEKQRHGNFDQNGVEHQRKVHFRPLPDGKQDEAAYARVVEQHQINGDHFQKIDIDPAAGRYGGIMLHAR